ncbi:hypothetical protein BAUCODRAFT_358554 [Baudoinia panamericana UAMH 10762]|uniref:Uncharacterized protein n=1 Tax=Baudoinia panamericana (strain UAMH 10762) TaxID=717646 RepID=M2MSZ0_BAUPA|nr:uncharacterized protein BAUCODRAFT_358554 [Baudoinia panamericana UAMH 10762]EMC99986.1 hypothetical protein BAUCODRAFT_358554 [Baudoinia panamericana UAMH 10762]
MRNAARAAAHCANAIWITDDVLADAFNRFLRVSRSCRRHGSNIPGPLEARRRQARRRMGLAATAAAASPSTIDFGALFGLGAKQPDMSYKWEPPSLQLPQAGLLIGPPPSPPQALNEKSAQSQIRSCWRRPAETAKVDPVAAAVKASQYAFNGLLDSLASKTEIRHVDMLRIERFLQSSAHEPEACNLLRLVSWLESRSISEPAARILMVCAVDKIQLQTISLQEVSAVVQAVLQCGRTDFLWKDIVRILDALTETDCHIAVVQLSQRLSQWLVGEATTPDHAALGRWLQILDNCQHTKTLSRSHHSVWGEVYSNIAAGACPVQLATHFRDIEDEDFARILLCFWVPHLDSPAETPERMDRRDRIVFSFPAKWEQPPRNMEHLVTEYDSLRAQHQQYLASLTQDMYEESPPCATAQMFGLLSKHRLNYSGLLCEAVGVHKANGASRRLWALLRDCRQQRPFGISSDAAQDAIGYFLSTGKERDVECAWRVFSFTPSLSVMRCYELPLKLIQHNLATANRIFDALKRQVASDMVPPELRQIRKLSLLPEHIELAQLIAYAWADQERFSSRVAFRRVWELYRFLQDRGAPLSPLISRALVKAGITRYIVERKPVPLAQVRYILSVVHRVEGPDAARSLDSLVFDVNDPLRYLGSLGRRNLWADAPGGHFAKAARWRMRLWIRRNRWQHQSNISPTTGRSNVDARLPATRTVWPEDAGFSDVEPDSDVEGHWRQDVDELTVAAVNGIHEHADEGTKPLRSEAAEPLTSADSQSQKGDEGEDIPTTDNDADPMKTPSPGHTKPIGTEEVHVFTPFSNMLNGSLNEVTTSPDEAKSGLVVEKGFCTASDQTTTSPSTASVKVDRAVGDRRTPTSACFPRSAFYIHRPLDGITQMRSDKALALVRLAPVEGADNSEDLSRRDEILMPTVGNEIRFVREERGVNAAQWQAVRRQWIKRRQYSARIMDQAVRNR